MLLADIWGPVGVAIGLIGVVVAVVVAWWFGRGPRLVTQFSGASLVGAQSDERISVLYDGNPVPRITQTQLWLWREGRGTIRGSDVVQTDPILVSVPEGERVLQATVLVQTRLTNDIRVHFDPVRGGRRVLLTFAYLEPRQGAVIEIIHTGESPEAVMVSGTLIGLPKGIQRVVETVEVDLPVSLVGSISVSIPTHSIPRQLRIASGEHTTRALDLTPAGIVAALLRRIINNLLGPNNRGQA